MICISANDVKRKKSKNISSTSLNNPYSSGNMKNYNLDEWLELSFRNSFANSDTFGHSNTNVNSPGSRPAAPDNMHNRYLKVLINRNRITREVGP